MKRMFLLMACAVVLGGCATRTPMPAWKPVEPVAAPAPIVDAQGKEIERIPFRAGVSSVTVEQLAKAQGCTSEQGAGLLTPQGPVEEYRVVCDSNKVFTAKCEFRQCKATSPTPAGGYALPPGVAPQPGASTLGLPMEQAMARTLGQREVPKLSIVWNCKDCGTNDKVAALIEQSYARAAAAGGFKVSASETAKVSIVDFRQRPPAVRVMFGIMAGKDRLAVETVFRGQTTTAQDVSWNAWVGMNSLVDNVGKQTFSQVSGGAM